MIKIQQKPLFEEVYVEFVEPAHMRYDTLADWTVENEALFVTLPDIPAVHEHHDFTYLLVKHEVTEAELCRATGITQEMVDHFDMGFTGDGEPGEHPAAPYHAAHMAAELLEHLLAATLDIDWTEYVRWTEQVYELVKHARRTAP